MGGQNKWLIIVLQFISLFCDNLRPVLITAKVFGMDTKPNFSVANEEAISTAPSVDFGDSTEKSAE